MYCKIKKLENGKYYVFFILEDGTVQDSMHSFKTRKKAKEFAAKYGGTK